jgi:hypothetical protein
MPKGLKETSGVIVISANVAESAPGTFTSERVDLQLNALDQEVFIVYAIDLDVENPELIAATNTTSRMSLSTTARTSVGSIANTNVLGAARVAVQDNGVTAIVTEYSSDTAPHSQLEYIGIIATNDFYLNIQGTNNVGTMAGQARLWGVRAKADASIYAALTQSELLSA